MNPIFYLISFVMFAVTIIGCTINGAIVYVILVNKQLQTVNNTFVVSMCINGFLISSLGTIFTAATSVKGEWIFGESICHFHSFVIFFLGLAIIATLTSMAIEKYIVIRFESRNMVTKKVCMFMLFGCHVYGLVIALMPFMGWNSYQLEGYNITCSLKMDGEDLNSTSFNIFMLIIGLICPLGVMIFVYSRIIVTMKEKRKSSAFITYSSHRKNILKREIEVTKTILGMIGAFSIAWTPYAMHCIISMLGLTKGMSPFMATVPALIAKSSVIYHPLIYMCKNRPLKGAICRTFLCRHDRKRDSHGTFVTIPPKEEIAFNQKGAKMTITITVDDEADFSQLASSKAI